MARLRTCKESDLSTMTLDALEHTRISGELADVYLQFANSEPAIRGYLQMEAALREGALSNHDLECIKLLVSELTQCHYCLAMHTMKARKAGVDKAMQIAIRRGDALDDKRLNVMMSIVRQLYTQPGTLDAALLDEARSNGITDTELLDITMAMSTIFFTNMTNHINDTEVKLPAAPSIK